MLRVIRFAGALVAGLGILAHGSEAPAQDPTLKAGTLVCKTEGGVGLILGSKEFFQCTYHGVDGAARERYTGTITKIGLDIGIKGAGTIIWGVLYSTSEIPPRKLEGDYAGVSADVSVGIGAGANALLGGSNNTVALQPLSVEGEIGLDIAVGISGLTLRAVD